MYCSLSQDFYCFSPAWLRSDENGSRLLHEKKISRLAMVALTLAGAAFSNFADGETTRDTFAAELLSKENLVDTMSPSAAWHPALVGQKLLMHDRLRTAEDSRAAVRMTDASVLRLDELTEIEILPPQAANAKSILDLKQGRAYFFSREKSREINIQTPAVSGSIRGTEFVVAVTADGNTSFIVLNGEVELSNAQGSLVLRNCERADFKAGGKPTKTAVIDAVTSVQWCLYYPGVLDLNDLKLPSSVSDLFQESISAYNEGDLLTALEKYPPGRSPESAPEKVYRAALFLAVGRVEKAELLLQDLSDDTPGRGALSTSLDAVSLRAKTSARPSVTASDWIAGSYYEQSRNNFEVALAAARRATELDPGFGFAWTRVAELEFSFGRVSRAKTALEKGLDLASRNPAAHVLRGFLLSAENKIDDANDAFEKAIALNSALGDAWFGRALCLIRQGRVEAARRDLQTAAAMEPNRSIFDGYFTKAFSNLEGGEKMRKDLDRARQIDPQIPTPCLKDRVGHKTGDNRSRRHEQTEERDARGKPKPPTASTSESTTKPSAHPQRPTTPPNEPVYIGRPVLAIPPVPPGPRPTTTPGKRPSGRSKALSTATPTPRPTATPDDQGQRRKRHQTGEAGAQPTESPWR